MKKLVCESITPPTCGTFAFTSIQKWGCTLYVPENSIESYKSTSAWSEFANIKGISTGIQDINADGCIVVSSNTGNITVSGTTSGETIDV